MNITFGKDNKKISVKKIEKFEDDNACEKFWFILDDEKYLFKENPYYARSDIGEVFASYIFHKLNLPSNKFVDYQFAKAENYNLGTICKKFNEGKKTKTINIFNIAFSNYCKENKLKFKTEKEKENVIKEFDEYQDKISQGQYCNCVEYTLDELKKYCQGNKIESNLDEIEKDLKKLFLIDFFLCQTDRHMGNIEFIKTKGVNCEEIKMCPLFDNGFILGLDNYFGKGDEIPKEERLKKALKSKFGLSEAGRIEPSLKENSIYNKNDEIVFIKNKYFADGGIMVSDVLDLIKDDDELKKLYLKFTNLDINKQINDFEKEYNFDVPQKEKNLMAEIYNARLEQIKNFGTKINNRLKKSKSPKRIETYLQK